MPLGIQVEIAGSPRAIMQREANAIRVGALRGVTAQTRETQNAARAVVASALTTRSSRTIRSKVYSDTPAGFIYSKWGYFRGGQFVDILAAHERGALITAKGKLLFIPLGRRRRRRAGSQPFDSSKVILIPTKRGGYLVIPKRRARGGVQAQPIGLLVPSVQLRKTLDFTRVEAAAEAGLAQKVLVEIEKAADA